MGKKLGREEGKRKKEIERGNPSFASAARTTARRKRKTKENLFHFNKIERRNIK